jgi:hypothetical protein
MTRFIVNGLALVGALSMLLASAAWVSHNIRADVVTGRVLGPDGRPLSRLSVFLDRGTNLSERYETDSAGVFTLPLFPREPHRATWLICAPGALPIVDRPQRGEFAGSVATFRSYIA